MAYVVTISKQLTPAYATPPNSPVRLVITVTAVTTFADKGLFTFVIDPVSAVRRFNNVATPNDLATYDLTTPSPGDQYVRLLTLDAVYENAETANNVILSVQSQLQELCNEMQRLQTLATPVSVTISS